MSVAMCKKTPPGVGYDNSNMGGVYAEDKLTTTSLSLGAAGRQGIENLVRSGRGGVYASMLKPSVLFCANTGLFERSAFVVYCLFALSSVCMRRNRPCNV